MARGVTRGAQFPGRQFTMGALSHCRGAELLLEVPKSPNNVTSSFFNTVNLPSKELGFDHGGAKRRPWGCRICFLTWAPYNLVTPLKTASPRDLSWRPFSSTPTSLTCQPPSTERDAYADDLAITHADRDWQALEGVLTKDMATVGECLQTWKLKLSTTKTVSAVFHLNNKEAKHELKVNFNDETCHFAPNPNSWE